MFSSTSRSPLGVELSGAVGFAGRHLGDATSACAALLVTGARAAGRGQLSREDTAAPTAPTGEVKA